MNILLLNYEFPPMGGGAGRATFNIALELVKMGHKVDVLTSRFKGQKSEEEISGINIYRVYSLRNGIHDCGLKGAYTYLFFAAFKLWQLNNKTKYHILHYFFSLPTGLLSLLPGKHNKIPYIVSLRGSDVPFYDIYNKKLNVFHSILKPVTTYIWRKSKHIVALSNGLKKIAKETAPNYTFKVIPNGIDTNIFNKYSNTKNSTSQLKLITVSRLIERKGIGNILKALSELNDDNISLLIVGKGNYENNLKKVCSGLNLDDKVSFYGYCPREKLTPLYNNSHVFILTSYAESFGIVFAEAMACGLPIIASNIGGIPELIKEDNGILVEPDDVEAIKKAIIKMKTSENFRVQMGMDNRKKVVQYYSWSMVAKRYFDLYQNEKY